MKREDGILLQRHGENGETRAYWRTYHGGGKWLKFRYWWCFAGDWKHVATDQLSSIALDRLRSILASQPSGAPHATPELHISETELASIDRAGHRASPAQVEALVREVRWLRGRGGAAYHASLASPAASEADIIAAATPSIRARALDEIGEYTPWPLRSVLNVLANATEHLLKGHDCDHHGHEETSAALTAARQILHHFPPVPAPVPASATPPTPSEMLAHMGPQTLEELASALLCPCGDQDRPGHPLAWCEAGVAREESRQASATPGETPDGGEGGK